MSEELTRILQNTYQGPEAQLQNYRDKRQVEELLYRNGYYLDNRIETIAIFPENSDMFYYCTKETINPAYDVREEKWYSRILEKEGEQALIGIHQNGLVQASFQARQPYCVTIGRSIYSAYESRLLGTIIINVNVRDLQELWPEPDQNFQEKFYLVDDSRPRLCARAGFSKRGRLRMFSSPRPPTQCTVSGASPMRTTRAALNGANEEAVKHFLNGKIGFLDIGKLAESSVESFSYREITSYEDVIEIDKAARDFVNSRVN